MQKILEQYITKYKIAIDHGIAQEIEERLVEVTKISPHLTPIIEAMKELSVGGKRLRAILTLLGYEHAGGVVNDQIIRLAVAMEIFHLGLLIQDDVMDQDKLRRGVTTIQARYPDLHMGESVATLAGDYTFGWVTEILSGLDLPSAKIVAATQIWGRYFTRVGYGQTLDLLGEYRGEPSEAEILQVLALKSGEYSCVLPLLIGASVANPDLPISERLKLFGYELGWVFQLRDDYLAEYGESSKTGKPVGNDRREGKRTIVTIYGKDKSTEVLLTHLKKGKSLVSDDKLLTAVIEYVAERDN